MADTEWDPGPHVFTPSSLLSATVAHSLNSRDTADGSADSTVTILVQALHFAHLKAHKSLELAIRVCSIHLSIQQIHMYQANTMAQALPRELAIQEGHQGRSSHPHGAHTLVVQSQEDSTREGSGSEWGWGRTAQGRALARTETLCAWSRRQAETSWGRGLRKSSHITQGLEDYSKGSKILSELTANSWGLFSRRITSSDTI